MGLYVSSRELFERVVSETCESGTIARSNAAVRANIKRGCELEVLDWVARVATVVVVVVVRN